MKRSKTFVASILALLVIEAVAWLGGYYLHLQALVEN